MYVMECCLFNILEVLPSKYYCKIFIDLCDWFSGDCLLLIQKILVRADPTNT